MSVVILLEAAINGEKWFLEKAHESSVIDLDVQRECVT